MDPIDIYETGQSFHNIVWRLVNVSREGSGNVS